MLAAAARCLSPTGRCIVLDMVLPDRPALSNAHRRLLIRMDRGEHCRKLQGLENLLTKYFRFRRAEQFYLKLVLIPLWDMRLFVCEKERRLMCFPQLLRHIREWKLSFLSFENQ